VPVDYGRVPWVVYTHPEVAWAGLTEAEARAAGHDVEVHKHAFAGNGRAMIIGDTDGMVKVVAQRCGPILGVHLVGPWRAGRVTTTLPPSGSGGPAPPPAARRASNQQKKRPDQRVGGLAWSAEPVHGSTQWLAVSARHPSRHRGK
jgi:hypothetical protein